MDLFFLKLCWKNIWRNKRRTLLTVNAIGAGVMALVALRNYYDAYHEQVIHNVIRYQSGHLLITAPGYQTNNAPNSYLRNPSDIIRWIARQKEIKAFSTRVLGQGLLSSSRGSASVVFSGIDPKKERLITRFSSNIVRGSYLNTPKKKAIVVGKKLAKNLKLKLGSKVVALTQGVDGSIGNDLFHVVGIFETHSDWDKSLAFVRSEDARSLLSLPYLAIHQISIVLKEESDLGTVKAAFHQTFATPRAHMLTWMELQKPIMAMIDLNKSANHLLMLIILFVAALGIANSILMSILERTREFGVMMAIGTHKAEVIRMVVLETLLLTLIGVIAGNGMGIALTLYFGRHGFDLAWLTSHKIVIEGTIIQTINYPTVHPYNSLVITGVIVALSLLVSFIPVLHIQKLKTVEALRAH